MSGRSKKFCAAALCALILAASMLLFAGCSVSAAESYTDFLAEFDVITRMEIAFAQIADGSENFFTWRDLTVLREDIASYSWADELAAQTSAEYDGACDYLLQCMEARKDGNIKEADALFQLAAGCFIEAQYYMGELRRNYATN